MTGEVEILKMVCERLNHDNITYMLTGSFAANLYAVPRMTRDIDIVIDFLNFDQKRFFDLFRADFYLDENAINDAIKNYGMFNIIHNESVFKIDFIVRKSSVYRLTEFKRRQQLQLDEAKIWIVSPEDLIISKLDWAKDSHSEMQLKDIRNLSKSIKNLDNEYIRHWVQMLELGEIYAKV